MFDLEAVLVFYKDLEKQHLENIKSHSWIENIVVISKNHIIRVGPTICERCKVEFMLVLHDRYDANGKLWTKFNCNEIMIKNY